MHVNFADKCKAQNLTPSPLSPCFSILCKFASSIFQFFQKKNLIFSSLLLPILLSSCLLLPFFSISLRLQLSRIFLGGAPVFHTFSPENFSFPKLKKINFYLFYIMPSLFGEKVSCSDRILRKSARNGTQTGASFQSNKNPVKKPPLWKLSGRPRAAPSFFHPRKVRYATRGCESNLDSRSAPLFSVLSSQNLNCTPGMYIVARYSH